MTNLISFELKRIFGRLSTYIYFALFLACEGYFFCNINLYGMSPAPEYTMEILTIPLMLCLPLITFSAVSKDTSSNFYSVLCSLKISPLQVILAKFTASFTVFAISSLPLAVIPFILSAMAKVNLVSAFVGLLGFLIFGASVIALGILVSSVTAKPLYSALFTYGAVVFTYLCEVTASVFSTNTSALFFALTVISLLLSLAFMRVTRSDYGWLAVLCVLEAINLVLRFVFPNALKALGNNVLEFIGIRASVLGFCYGLFDISDALNFILFTALMLSLAVLSLRSEKYLKAR